MGNPAIWEGHGPQTVEYGYQKANFFTFRKKDRESIDHHYNEWSHQPWGKPCYEGWGEQKVILIGNS